MTPDTIKAWVYYPTATDISGTPFFNATSWKPNAIPKTPARKTSTLKEAKETPKKEPKVEATIPSPRLLLNTVGGMKFELDREELEVYLIADGTEQKIKEVAYKELITKLRTTEKLSVDIKSAMSRVSTWFTLWDRIFLYWPTGTGKTHQIIQWIKDKKIKHDIVQVSDWFEDIDFLTYIVPTATGIMYKEKSIISLFRDAAKGEKVAVLIDEVNRWSKSFMNLVLKMLDPVTWSYEINNFVADEKIVVPKENIIRFCTANLWGSYSGTNELDEALLDRFNKIEFVDYNKDFEEQLFDCFDTQRSNAKVIVEYIRTLFKDNSIKRPVSSRTLKSWAEEFINTSKNPEDLFATFEKTIMYRIIGIDSYWFPNEQDIWVLASKFIELWIINKK